MRTDSGFLEHVNLVVIACEALTRNQHFDERALEWKEVCFFVTSPSLALIGRVPAELPSTPMQLIKALIPLLQPGGMLDVPSDDWAALNEFVAGRYGGHIHVREKRVSGFTVVGADERGLPCLELTVEVPDEVDIANVVNGEFDEKLKDTLTRNVRAVRDLRAA